MLVCCSSDCEKCKQCGKYIYNLSDKYRKQPNTVEPLASFGWGSIGMNSQGETHCEVHTDCGFNGKYAMFEPIEGSIVGEGLNPSNILRPQPNTINLGNCDKIVLSPKGLEIEVDLKINDFDKFEFIEINGRRFKRVRE